jgi:hypothetical protein
MLLKQNPETGYWTDTEIPNIRIAGIHAIFDCRKPCAIHNSPSDHKLSTAPLNWNEHRGILERICSHGLGHPDHDSALYYNSTNQGNTNVHACDGCC